MAFSPRRSAILLAALPVLALTACGSDDGGSGSAGTTATAAAATGGATAAAGTAGGTLDKAALAAQANAVCKATNDKADALTLPANADDDHRAGYYAKLAALTADQQAGLEALTPDDAAKAQWEAFVALTKEATDLVQEIPPAIRVDAGGKSQALADRVSALSPRINAAADAFGARICGSDSGKS